MVFRRWWGVITILLASLLSACSGPIDPANNTVELFSGTLIVGGQVTFNYSWSKNGEIEVTMTSVVPTPTNGPVWMQLGQVTNGSCFLFGSPQQAIVNRTVPYGLLNKGSYCLTVFDPGGVLTIPVNFSGKFSHP